MYNYRIEQAIRAAAVLHRDQTRKGSVRLPYVTHLYAVALLVGDYTDDENTVIAALLHDTLEDTDYTADELENDFGPRVRELVLAVSEPKTDTDGKPLSWAKRKAVYAKGLKTAPEAALLIAAADKIHNMRSLVEQYYDNYAGLQKDFGGALDERVMMYQDISNTLNSRLKNDIIAEFNHVYTEYKNFILDVKKSQNESVRGQ